MDTNFNTLHLPVANIEPFSPLSGFLNCEVDNGGVMCAL